MMRLTDIIPGLEDGPKTHENWHSMIEDAAEKLIRIEAAHKKGKTGPVQIYQIPCDCALCMKQLRTVHEQENEIGLSYTGQLSKAETVATARNFSHHLIADLRIVQSALRSHEELIRTSWLRKSNTKRKAWLKRLRPNMGDDHDAYEGTQMSDASTLWTWEFRETLLLPYLTVETLSKDPTRLLRLLHYRSFYPPEDWVPFDNRQLHEGWRSGFLEEKYNDGCITMYGENYGSWNQFNKTAGK